MVSICINPDEELDSSNNPKEIVKGRVFQYDDQTKILILKLWDDDAQGYVGMGVYHG